MPEYVASYGAYRREILQPMRAALQALTGGGLAGTIVLPPHHVLVADFEACVRDGGAALVHAPHFTAEPDGLVHVRRVLESIMAQARATSSSEDAGYLELVDGIIAHGTLAERIRAHVEPYAGDDTGFRDALRRVYTELADCLVSNEPWAGRHGD